MGGDLHCDFSVERSNNVGLFKKKYGMKDSGEYSLVAEPADGADVAASLDVADAAEAAADAQTAIEAADTAATMAAEAEGESLGSMFEDSSLGTGEAAVVKEELQDKGDSAAEVDEIMRKYDRESNTRIWEGIPKVIISVLMAAFSVYCIWMTLFSTALPQTKLTLFVGLIVVIGYLMYPARKGKVRVNYIPWYDIIIMVVGAACFFYFAFNALDVIHMGQRLQPLQITVGVLGILVVAELCRRCVGLPIIFVVFALIIYAFWWQFDHGLTPFLALRQVVFTLFYTTDGLIGTPVNVCYTYIVLFIIFGAFLERTGIAAFFISLANRLAGWSSGGAAKVAVISSALCGMVSGSSVGNTVTTGSVTIPMMKKTGYKPEFAGAVEAASSTGGQIMPPIMGAAAFLMAEYMGIPYIEVAAKAIIPALLYFAGIFITVHLEAKKLGLKGIPRNELPKASYLLKNCYLIIPLVLLVWLVASGARTMAVSAALSILGAFIIGYINFFLTQLRERKEGESLGQVFVDVTKVALAAAYESLQAGAKSCVAVAVACAMAGMIAGCITVTGLASTLVNVIVTAAGDAVIIGLVLTMLTCIVLGMGVPTTANYCIMASTTAPILIAMGIDPIAAHFFVFYFGIVADITPPVALAAYAGSAIARSNPMKTGVNAAKLAIAAFIVPYILAFNPVMILEGSFAWWQLAQVICTSLVGLFGISSALNGNLFSKINPVFRLLLVGGGLLMMDPGTFSDLIGVAIIAAVVAAQWFWSRHKTHGDPRPAAA